jgi:hypothetical protein
MLPKPLILHPLQTSLPHRRGRGPRVEIGLVGGGRDDEVCGQVLPSLCSRWGDWFGEGAGTVKICFAVQGPSVR